MIHLKFKIQNSKLIIFLSILFFSQAGEVFSQQGKPFSQKECDCDNVDTTDRTSRKVVLTNIQLLKEGADYFIQGNCCDIVRAFWNGSERESVRCISKKTQKFRLLDAIPYSLFYEDKGEKQHIFTEKWAKAKPFFLKEKAFLATVFIEVGVSNQDNSLLWVYTRNYE